MPFLRLVSFFVLALLTTGLRAQKLKVYILAGQSNMQGQAKVSTFDYIGEDPKTAPMLADMQDADGKPRVLDHVWISYLTGGRGGNGEGHGRLTAGYGARKNPAEDGGKIGPELTFGIRMAKAYDGPILLIKTAWGGKSLNTDFRPPSAGPYEFDEKTLDRLKAQNKDIEQIKADRAAKTGRYYRFMIDHVKHVLSDIERYCPDYHPDDGYEISGFVWFQGWNDMVDRGTYPDRDKPGGYARYSRCLAHFIRDVRKDLNVPGMPFVIGVMGVNGRLKPGERYTKTHSNFRAAMAAPASMPEFKGNVVAVQTAPYWDEKLAEIANKMGKVRNMARMLRTKNKNAPNRDGTMSREKQRAYLEKYRAEVVGADDEATYKRGASNAAYHYLGCAKTMAGIGNAFAEAILGLEKH